MIQKSYNFVDVHRPKILYKCVREDDSFISQKNSAAVDKARHTLRLSGNAHVPFPTSAYAVIYSYASSAAADIAVTWTKCQSGR